MKWSAVSLFFLMFSLTAFTGQEKVKLLPTNYGLNEVFQLRVHYGFITAGEARVEVSKTYYKLDNKICTKATCTGKSSAAFDFVIKIRDAWTTYIDTTTKASLMSARHIEEGGYRLNEAVKFDYDKKKAFVNWEKKVNEKGREEYAIDGSSLQDIVSGAYYLRVVDYANLKVDDIISVNSFFENQLYDLKIRYKGKEKVDTDFGEIEAFKLVPIMPQNGLFAGENSIKLWLSADKNRLPLKIKAEMFVGAVEVDLKAYSNLKYPINFE